MSSSARNEPISIAIIGAGIAGITLAIALSRHNPNLHVTIYESRPGFSEIGAGVGMLILYISSLFPLIHDLYPPYSLSYRTQDLDPMPSKR